MTAGAGGAAAGTSAAGAGGAASLIAGAGGAKSSTANAAGGAGGAVVITAGTGGTTASNGADDAGAGGAITLTAGTGGAAAASSGNGGVGGNISLVPGAGGACAGGTAGKTGMIRLAGTVSRTQPTPAAETDTATLSAADLLAGIITLTKVADAGATMTLDTGANMELARQWSNNDAIDWVFINVSAGVAAIATITAAGGHTIVGNALVPSAHTNTGGTWGTNSARFRTVRTAADTFVTYRV